MRYILALSVLACLAASPPFAWGNNTGAGTGGGTGGSAGTGGTDGHGEADARGGLGGVGGEVGMRWNEELGCVEGTFARCNSNSNK